MAFDIARRKTTPRNWSRGHDVGTVGAASTGEGKLSRKLVIGAALGAAAAAGFLAWRSHHHAQRFARGYRRSTHPMARTVVYDRGPGGSLLRRV